MPRRASVLAISSVLAAGVLVGGAYVVNAATSPSTTITACSHKKTGAVRIVSAKAKCKSNEKRVTWNVKGATGAQGLTGLGGPAGPAGSTGPAGADGRDGEDGKNGVDGKDGAPGAPGADGEDGKDGAMGPAGPAGGAAEVDPNPNDLTYWMSVGDDPIVQVNGFTQKVSNSGSMQSGPGGGAGKAEFGDIVMTFPMNSVVMDQMMRLAKGTHVPKARVDMCKPGEPTPDLQRNTFGKCALSLDLSEVIVTALDVRQDPEQATVTAQLNFAREKISVSPGTRDAAAFEWDIAENVEVGSSSGSARATSTGDTTYTTKLGNLDSLSTRSWSQGSSQSGTTHAGGGGGAGKANFANVSAETRTGPGTVALLRAVAKGTHIPTVQIDGCESSECTSRTVLNDVLVSELVIGSPTLFDQVQFNYGKIDWKRRDGARDQEKSFFWDVAAAAMGM